MLNFYDNISDIMNYCHENNIGNEGCLIECIFYLYIKIININIDMQAGMFDSTFILL